MQVTRLPPGKYVLLIDHTDHKDYTDPTDQECMYLSCLKDPGHPVENVDDLPEVWSNPMAYTYSTYVPWHIFFGEKNPSCAEIGIFFEPHLRTKRQKNKEQNST